MAKVLMYSTRVCSYCSMAERLLGRRGVPVEKILVDEDAAQREEMTRRTGRSSVPQIFIGTKHIGGYSELAQLDRDGQLEDLLQQP